MDADSDVIERAEKLLGLAPGRRGDPSRSAQVAAPPPLRRVTAGELLRMTIPPLVSVVGPITERSLAMFYGPRGIGKTWFTLSVAYAGAAGGAAFGMQAPRPRRVCLLDGEMPAAALQERLRHVAAMSDADAPEDHLSIVARDLQPDGRMFNLATDGGQRRADEAIGDAELVILDNLSALSSARENEGDDWHAIGEWLMRHRAAGRAVVVIHHAGKGGQQRGTSRREDVLDVVLALRRPADYEPRNGADFEVHYEKARALVGEGLDPFRATLIAGADGLLRWQVRPVADALLEEVRELAADGMTTTQIAAELNLSRFQLRRLIKQAEADGAAIEIRSGRGGARTPRQGGDDQ